MTLNTTWTFATNKLRSALPPPDENDHSTFPLPTSSTTSTPSSPPSISSSSSSSPTFVLPSPKRTRPSPPKLHLPTLSTTKDKGGQPERDLPTRPILFVQPASPALSPPPPTTDLSTSHNATSPLESTNSIPFPAPIPSTSSPPRNNLAPSSSNGSPNNGGGVGSGLAARRAAKLGKKRLSLVVPTPSTSGSSGSLLSPTTPSHLHHRITTNPLSEEPLETTLTTTTLLNEDDDLEASETRSLPPSPISLVTFIGTEGSEQPDRTIGRLMLKQQADEMREQMRGGRGMKRRTSIPRLNLSKANNPPPAVNGTNGTGSGTGRGKPKPSLSLGGGRDGGGGGNVSAVQFLWRDPSQELEDNGEEVEEFPYALGPREILPGIYLGSEQNARDPKVLDEWKFGFVLNVAKEVDCPWTDEVIEEREGTDNKEGNQEDEGVNGFQEGKGKGDTPASPPRKHKHRRTKTQAAIDVRSPAGNPSNQSTEARPIRPPFIRPTASTPNLQSVFRSSSAANSTAPPVPSIPKIHLPATPDASEDMLRSLSSSPPNSFSPMPRRSPPRVRIHPHTSTAPPVSAAANPLSTCRSKGVVRFPRNRNTGRPSIEYLWLKWGHDEADLVEAHKFQSAFDFLDEARDRGEKVLVHCQCGVSRSATVVIAYCMREAAKALEEGRDAKELSGCTGMHDTYSFVKEKSEWVGPNLGLVFQLVAYERTLRGDSNDPADEEEAGYPHYPPEPVTADSNNNSFPTYPQTPNSLDDSMSRSQFSTPDLHLSLSPTSSSGTQQSSVTSTPITIQLPNGTPQPRIAKPGEQDEQDFGIRDRHGSSETLKGEPAVFVLSPPPIPNSTSSHSLREELVSPTVASYPSPAPSPLELPTKGRTARRPPPISLYGASLSAHSLVPSPTNTVSSTTPTYRPPPSASLPTLNTSGLPNLAHARLSPNGIMSPDSAVTMSSDSSGNSASNASGTPGTTIKKFGAQSKSERRASHRRVFSETIQVPTSIKSSWSSHSLHSGGE
ncbi:hypothetical protein JCM16303_007008 [Sporobolomyces ruberrimus]